MFSCEGEADEKGYLNSDHKKYSRLRCQKFGVLEPVSSSNHVRYWHTGLVFTCLCRLVSSLVLPCGLLCCDFHILGNYEGWFATSCFGALSLEKCIIILSSL